MSQPSVRPAARSARALAAAVLRKLLAGRTTRSPSLGYGGGRPSVVEPDHTIHGECAVAESDDHHRLSCVRATPRGGRSTQDLFSSSRHAQMVRPRVIQQSAKSCSRSSVSSAATDPNIRGVHQWELAILRRDVITLEWKSGPAGTYANRRRAACCSGVNRNEEMHSAAVVASFPRGRADCTSQSKMFSPWT